ncbi:tRNA pseudouridine(38-40) synthase TruA [Kushneria aurantia]|uniref:tRNA pseudouridine synthase A n=1 Tax=Kushneria aurantia TaxID=504092 RepID=A0ABV6G6F2_9GAMM|nr:tRNA pseudouridine(38-40) synthase TruA [Kushneria aurantia]
MSLFEPIDENERIAGRIALGIEYRGTHYQGWQRLRHGPSVQAALEQALSKVAVAPLEVMCSGRTDSGVHASRQIVHFDCDRPRTLKAWVMGTNVNLPRDVSVRWAHPVPLDFHARFCSLARRYRYLIANQPVPPALDAEQMIWHRVPLDVERMQQAAQALVGEHDFSGFRAAGCQSRTPWRHVHFIEVQRIGPLVVIDIQANAFVHHMVRNIAGALLTVGDGRQGVERCGDILARGDRRRAEATAPAQGLHFVDVYYDARFDLPREPLGPSPLWFRGEWSGERRLPPSNYRRPVYRGEPRRPSQPDEIPEEGRP